VGRKKTLLLMLLLAVLTLTAGCLNEKGNPLPSEKAPQRTALQQTDPKQVAEALVRAQVKNDRKTIDKLLTPRLKETFVEKDLYLFNSEQLKDKDVILNNIQVTEKNSGKKNAKLYSIKYELTIEEDKVKEPRQVVDLVFVTKDKKSGKWFVSTYQHVLFQ